MLCLSAISLYQHMISNESFASFVLSQNSAWYNIVHIDTHLYTPGRILSILSTNWRPFLLLGLWHLASPLKRRRDQPLLLLCLLSNTRQLLRCIILPPYSTKSALSAKMPNTTVVVVSTSILTQEESKRIACYRATALLGSSRDC